MATPGNGISGITGDALIAGATAVQIHEVKKWSWKPKAENKDYASNITAGVKKRIPGVKDATGTIDGVWDPYNPITTQVDVGATITLHLQTTTAQYIVAPVIIDDLSIEVDIETGAVDSWTMSFSSNGAWTNAVALAATTTTTVVPLMGPFTQYEEAVPLAMVPTQQIAATKAAHEPHAAPAAISDEQMQSLACRLMAMMNPKPAAEHVAGGAQVAA